MVQFSAVLCLSSHLGIIFRLAKRKLDNRSFFGHQLHVTYAPEQESVSDTRDKLRQRRQDVISRSAGEILEASTLNSVCRSAFILANKPICSSTVRKWLLFFHMFDASVTIPGLIFRVTIAKALGR